MLGFDLLFMGFKVPAMIWLWLQERAAAAGLCDGTAGPNFELLLGAVFAVLIMAIEIFVFSGFGYIETFSVRKTFGFSKATPGQFV
jgi:hypothetical protein